MIGLLCMLIAAPPQINLDEFLPPTPPPVKCSDDMSNFPTFALPFDVPQTLYYHNVQNTELKALEIPPGYVVSTCELLRITNLRIEQKRLQTELAALRVLRDKEFQLWRVLENQYETQLTELLNPPWYERHRLQIGIAIGVMATSAVLITSAQLLR